jgi:hypothetical protein
MASTSDPRDRDSTTPPPQAQPSGSVPPSADVCDLCGSNRIVWRRCKLICENCHTILKSCADL